MFGNFFYNSGLRKLTVAFGTLFNKIQVQKNDLSGNTVQNIIVPLAYGPKEKFIVRLDQQKDLNSREFAVVLPRMGFEITGIVYDPSRKLTRVQKYKSVTNSASSPILNSNYTPVPYNINYTLNIFTANAENGLQIVEQILPYFQPDYTVTLNLIPELDIKRDIPIILNTVNYEDSYTGNFDARRAVIYTLNFTAKTYLFGPADTQKVILKTQADITTSSAENAPREERITVVPNPLNAQADTDFGFSTTIENFDDGKIWNSITDKDQ
jgi:hypothetical protein